MHPTVSSATEPQVSAAPRAHHLPELVGLVVCVRCEQQVTVRAGRLAGHDVRPPVRQVCPGSGKAVSCR